MSDIKQDIIFTGSGLNFDDDQRYIPMGDSPWRLNILVGGDYANGVLTNMQGNTRTVDITQHLLTLSNVYLTVGSFYNRLTRKCYYFVFSLPYDSTSSGDYIYDNKLFCYNEDLETLDLIFTDTKNYFGLNPNYLMKDCAMIGDSLYFNSRHSEPKMIDVTMAYNYTNYPAYDILSTYIYGDKVTYYGGLFVATGTVSAGQTPMASTSKWDKVGSSYIETTNVAIYDSEFRYAFNVIKMPPLTRPELFFGSNSNINSNNVRGKVFRFSYRYKYFDNSYSVYSAYSDVSLPKDDEVWNGEVIDEVYTNNYIRVVLLPHSPALVKEIEVVFQEISGDWRRAKIINRQSQDMIGSSTVSFDFYNNESYIQVTNVEVARVADAVPKQANSQEIVNKNILTYGGCLEGFDNLNKDDMRVLLTPEIEPLATTIDRGVTKRNNVPLDIVYSLGPDDIFQATIDMATAFASGLIAGNGYSITLNGISKDYILTAFDVVSVNNLATGIAAFITSEFGGGGWFDGCNASTQWVVIGTHDDYPVIDESIFYTLVAPASSIIKYRGFKTGANHPFCIFYYDGNLRRWDAQVSKDNTLIFGLETEGTTVYVPMFNEYPHPIVDTTAYRWVIDWEVYHLPPEGAKYWRWGYAGNSLCDNMVQYIVSSVTTSGHMCKIDITPLQTLKTTATAGWNQFPHSNIDAYKWTAGDRIRFITKKSAPGVGTTLGEPVDGVYEYEIIKQDDTDNTIYTQYFDYSIPDFGENTLVEIYSPLKSLEDTKIEFYELGELMPIIEDSAGIPVHAGENGLHNQDTVLSHSAMGTFDSGDVYHILRTPSKPLDSVTTDKKVFHESMWYSDFYSSKDYDRGKIGVETTFGERFLNIVRYSDQFMQDTQINGLSSFQGNNYKELNDLYGDIVAIYEQGDTLKVYQERKASSILIGRTEYYDAGTSGGNAVVTSERVFGAIRYSPSNYSTVFPESISRNNRYLYGFDIYNGVAWRDSANGIFPISGRYAEAGGDADYKMQTYFKLKAKALMQSGIDHVNVISVWDEEYKLFYITFKDAVLETNNETLVFHEPSNRWVSFVSLEQTPVDGYNVILELDYTIVKGFEAGIGFSFDEDTRFAVFDIATPKNYAPTMDTASLGTAGYDPSSTVDCAPDADLDAVSVTAYDPTVTITDAPSITLTGINTIMPGAHGTPLYVFTSYTNTGDGTTENMDWRIRDAGLTVVSSGTQAIAFLGTTSAQFTLTLTYPSPSGNYTVQVKKSSTPTWAGAYTIGFFSS